MRQERHVVVILMLLNQLNLYTQGQFIHFFIKIFLISLINMFSAQDYLSLFQYSILQNILVKMLHLLI